MDTPNKPISQSTPLYRVDSNSTRLMIGLKWDQRKLNIVDQALPFTSNILINIFVLLGWVVTTVFGLLLLKEPKRPSFLLKSTLEHYVPSNKADDASSSRESNYSQYDLDLHCYAFDDKNEFLFLNGPENENIISEDAVMYSSGEEFTGRGVYDDETAYIDLRKITNKHANFFIVVVSDSKYDFASLDNKPIIRIVNSKIDKELASFTIPTDSELAPKCFAYIYARLSQNEGIWNLHPIEKFVDQESDVLPILQSYLNK